MKCLLVVLSVFLFSALLYAEKIEFNESRCLINYNDEQIANITVYKNGKLYTGKGKVRYDSGKINWTCYYKKGKIQKLMAWNENGTKSSRTYYKNGKAWRRISWYNNGKKHYRIYYKNEKLHGKETQWYKNSRKDFERNYKDGKLHGKYTWWYENGIKKKVCHYKDGKEIKCTEGIW